MNIQQNSEVVTNLAPQMKVVPALCLDFDGTIRRSKSGQTFIQNFQDIELIKETAVKKWVYDEVLIHYNLLNY